MRLLASLLMCASALGCADVDDRPPEWGTISRAIIQPNCATTACHSQFTGAGGLRMHDEVAGWCSLVSPGFVRPGDVESSMLVYLLRADETWRMPPDLPLPEADIELVEAWIAAGAPWSIDGGLPCE